ncbi:MAG TPA: hypothetical protein VHM92_04705 [Allosphingosinicella sp.]|nr:hypothetical protein [Allosphingosinicella sp.]
MLLLLLMQAAEPPAARPDIELGIQIRARSVKIEQKGEALLTVRGDAAGNRVDVDVQPRAQGKTELRNVRIEVHAQASFEQGAKIAAEAETGTPE